MLEMRPIAVTLQHARHCAHYFLQFNIPIRRYLLYPVQSSTRYCIYLLYLGSPGWSTRPLPATVNPQTRR